jgi:hypothetical protein
MAGATGEREIQMAWKSIDSQTDLDQLDGLICWEDSKTAEYYATPASEPYFPADISRSGFENKNIHILCEVCSKTAPLLELVFIDCDWLATNFLENISLHGRVDTLKRVEIWDLNKATLMRCSRLLYRFIDERLAKPGFYLRTSAEA